MWDYQNETNRAALQRSSRESETDKHPATPSPDQSCATGRSPEIALHVARATGPSGGNTGANQTAVSPRSFLQLQRIHGNQYINRMLQAAERKDNDSGVTPDVEQTIERSRGGGQALDTGVSQSIGTALNADFGAVRVHTDSQADSLNRSLQARAFTTGKDVYFRQGEYNPGSSSGRELLAHELTHVVQQGGSAVQSKNEEDNTGSTCSGCVARSTVGTLQTKLTLGAPNDVYEQEADSVARAYINSEHQPAAKDTTASQVRRQESEEEKEEPALQTKPDGSRLLRQPEEEKEKEALQAKLADSALQRQAEEEEEPVQAKREASFVQCQSERE
jgi:hypothetical protein